MEIIRKRNEMKETLGDQEGKKDPIVQLLKHLLIDEKNEVKN